MGGAEAALSPEDALLWQGRPAPGFRWSRKAVKRARVPPSSIPVALPQQQFALTELALGLPLLPLE